VEQLGVREAAIKREKEELKTHEAALKSKSDRKKDAAEPCIFRAREKGKIPMTHPVDKM
jgi:hypothetical protein